MPLIEEIFEDDSNKTTNETVQKPLIEDITAEEIREEKKSLLIEDVTEPTNPEGITIRDHPFISMDFKI